MSPLACARDALIGSVARRRVAAVVHQHIVVELQRIVCSVGAVVPWWLGTAAVGAIIPVGTCPRSMPT